MIWCWELRRGLSRSGEMEARFGCRVVHTEAETRLDLADDLDLGQRVDAEIRQAVPGVDDVGARVGQPRQRRDHPRLLLTEAAAAGSRGRNRGSAAIAPMAG